LADAITTKRLSFTSNFQSDTFKPTIDKIIDKIILLDCSQMEKLKYTDVSTAEGFTYYGTFFLLHNMTGKAVRRPSFAYHCK